VDVVFVTGDAYVDHPSFAMATLGRVLEAAGCSSSSSTSPAVSRSPARTVRTRTPCRSSASRVPF